jgi:hypothetical protein
LLTFANAQDIAPVIERLTVTDTEELHAPLFLNDESATRQEHRNVVVQFLKEAWEAYALARGLKKYEMSGKNAFYFDIDALPNPNVTFVGIDGNKTYRGLMGYRTRKTTGTRRHRHFALSARPVVHPRPLLQIRSHVLFSDNGRTMCASEDGLHNARRSQCKNWWNDDWRDRILAAMAWLAGDSKELKLVLSGGSGDATVSTRPIEFVSPVTLLEPGGVPEGFDRNDDLGEEGEELVEVTDGKE